MRFSLALLAASAALASAHSAVPETPEEIAEHQALQEAAYHCAPAIAKYTAQRKRSWAQKVLSGGRGSVDSSDLFVDGAFSDEDTSLQGGKLLACNEVQEKKIKNNTCLLAPETTQGPYYHTEGHPIRQNMAEYQPGLLFLMDIGIIDVETCEPLPNVLVDVWHANGTGHYAGHPDPAPHLVNEKPQVGGKRSGLLSAYPRTNEHETWLRAAWPTDETGVSQFTSIFPGYYTGRATHVHVRIHTEWDTLPNGTFTSHRLSHTGQLFVEDDLNLHVDKMWPYVTNPIKDTFGRTRNWRDSLSIFDDSHLNGYNPVFDTHLLGGIINQGVIGYATIGINKTAMYQVDGWRP